MLLTTHVQARKIGRITFVNSLHNKQSSIQSAVPIYLRQVVPKSQQAPDEAITPPATLDNHHQPVVSKQNEPACPDLDPDGYHKAPYSVHCNLRLIQPLSPEIDWVGLLVRTEVYGVHLYTLISRHLDLPSETASRALPKASVPLSYLWIFP